MITLIIYVIPAPELDTSSKFSVFWVKDNNSNPKLVHSLPFKATFTNTIQHLVQTKSKQL